MRCAAPALLLLLLLLPQPTPAWRSDIVKSWAKQLGDDLWGLNLALTKADQIKVKYKLMNASVKQKNGVQILESSLKSVGSMLTKKINAVKCIHATAKQLARDFNLTRDFNLSAIPDDFGYCSAKYSRFYNEESPDEPIERVNEPIFVKNNSHFNKEFHLERDSHFYDINVNTSTSCVHVPTNIYYLEPDTITAIVWSKGLNEIFKKNYESDPSLVWQYFGSSAGVLRFYPSMPWTVKDTDTYDCRVQSWYIEAATCSKDVVILFDVSGSMTGFKNYVARRTLQSLLDSLSNNDYVNVYVFKNETEEVITCFKNLVQATKENIKNIVDALEPPPKGKEPKFSLEGNANLTMAYIKAFQTLRERRTICDVNSTQGCNQLVMVITDYVPGNLSEVFEEHNREVVNGKVYIPVRVFTYLIGKEVTNVEEIKSMACTNRGYYVHIHSVEEVQEQVLKYINVIARPMILEGAEPPPTWTHASMDNTRTEKWGVSLDVAKPDEDKLVTSVAIPAFDTENNPDAVLLGVAGTDVPIDSIAKLAQPHQLGVNGYSFIVSNNGYLLLHPLLKTSINKELQVNYNSVDFVEVEQVDDGKGARELGDEIKWLRANLTHGKKGSMRNIKVLYHYDEMRRIARVKHDYFFNELVGTPFSMGISLPEGYGDTELMLKDNPLEAKQGKDLTGVNVTDYFRYSYRIHPDWVYCKYHYLEGHETPNPEIEIWNFLVNVSRNEVDITTKQYKLEEQSEFNVSTDCGTSPLGKDDYYCNEDLVKQLVFDAKLSAPYFQNWDDRTDEDLELARAYNVSVRFIMTSSGLTRWHYLFDSDKNEKVDDAGGRQKGYDGPVFGDVYATAIEQTLYKAAVLQRMIEKDSLVVATPLPILDPSILNPPVVTNEYDDITITASHAIFYEDTGIRTPASVVGYQFSYTSFRQKFLEITNSATRGSKAISCEKGYDCYVIDSSGYIVLALHEPEVGQFFGEMHPFVLQSLIDKNIFEYVEVFNYQALCERSNADTGNSWSLSTPFDLVKWALAEFFLLLTDLYNWNQYAHANVIVGDSQDEEPEEITEAPTSKPKTESIPAREDKKNIFSCDHSIKLYILNQSFFLNRIDNDRIVYEEEYGACHPPYWAAYVKNTNLLLVVVESDSDFTPDSCNNPPPTTVPTATDNSKSSSEPCHKLELGNLPRRRLEGCYTYHEKERNLTDCGLGTKIRADMYTIVIACMVSVAYRMVS